MALRAGLISWEVFCRAFTDRLFPREKREAKVEEFINLSKGGISLHEFSLKFNKSFTDAYSLVSNTKDEMNNFVTVVSDDLLEECLSAMIHENMEIFLLMVHAHHVEEGRIHWKNRDDKSAKFYEEGTSKGNFEIHYKLSSRRDSPTNFLLYLIGYKG